MHTPAAPLQLDAALAVAATYAREERRAGWKTALRWIALTVFYALPLVVGGGLVALGCYGLLEASSSTDSWNLHPVLALFGGAAWDACYLVAAPIVVFTARRRGPVGKLVAAGGAASALFGLGVFAFCVFIG